MREVPECLNRRYRAVDDLIQQLSWSVQRSGSNSPNGTNKVCDDPGIKMMCDFWHILKEDPNCDLKKQVKQRMGLTTSSIYNNHNHASLYPQNVTCFMSDKGDKEASKWKGCSKKLRSFCCQKPSGSGCSRTPPAPEAASSNTSSQPETSNQPLNKALSDVNEAATFETECNVKLTELVKTQENLSKQIEVLETRENEGIKLLKQADCMWACMEDAYKKRLQESEDRQNLLHKQLKEIDASSSKWRRNKKDIEDQVSNMEKNTQGYIDQIAQKKNDLKFMQLEIADKKKRIETSKGEMQNAQKCLTCKKQKTETKLANLQTEVARLQKLLAEEDTIKNSKEQNGNKFVKEARQELQNICRVLLKKRLENEDLRAEKVALLEEIDLLNVAMDQCKNRCKTKKDALTEDLQKLDERIAVYKNRCIQCHQCTDTNDVRRFCTDCPTCALERECLYEDEFCTLDNSLECVCMNVKQRFLDNIFENMYTVLESQSKHGQGKHIAEAIMDCLKRSRNGKLNQPTKKMLQEFILSTVKQNLGLTIVGGAVKTRCELDADTYKQLMVCLKSLSSSKVPKEKAEKATEKKDSCRHWRGRVSECNCPSGPKDCVCSQKAPPPATEFHPVPTEPPTHEEEVKPGEVLLCPGRQKTTACGPDCAAFDNIPMKVGAEMSKYRPDPCSGAVCPFNKNVRAVQCILGPEPLNAPPKSAATFLVPRIKCFDDMLSCSCSKTPERKSSTGQSVGHRSRPRERIIQEVMGRYNEVTPIEKVTSVCEHHFRRSGKDSEFSPEYNVSYIDEGCNNPTTQKIKTADKSCDGRPTNNKITVDKYCNRPPAENKKFVKSVSTTANALRYYYSWESIILDRKDASTIVNNQVKKHVDWTDISGHHELVQIFPSTNQTKSTNTDFLVILKSKFLPLKSKINKSTSPYTSFISTCNSRCSGATAEYYISKNYDESSVEYELSNADICDTAKDLLKEVIVSESEAKLYMRSDVEWMTIPSLINKLTKNSKSSISNSSNEEVEITNTTLEAKTFSMRENSNNNFVKSLLNDIVVEKVYMRDLNKYTHNTGSQYSYDAITSQVDPIKNSKERRDVNLFSSSSLSESTSSSIKQAESHTKCYDKHMKSGTAKFCHTGTGAVILGTAGQDYHPCNLVEREKPANKVLITEDKETFMTCNKNAKTYLTRLSKTNSGTLAIALDDVVTHLIDKKATENRNVSMNKTPSGHFKINFLKDLGTKDVPAYKAIARKSSSGTRTLEVYKRLIDNVETKDENKKKKENKITLKECPKCKNENSTEVERVLKNDKESTFNDSLMRELLKKYETKIAINIKVNGANGPITTIKSNVTKTSSGNLAIDINELSLLGENLHGAKNRDVVLNKLKSELFEININRKIKDPNACVKKTCSGNLLVVLTKPVPKNKELKPEREQYFKLTIKSHDNKEIDAPVVLKSTPSSNYLIVFDKEYEKESKKLIKDVVKDDIDYHINLDKTPSGSFLIHLDDNCCKSNALLVKSPCGNIKIVKKFLKCNKPLGPSSIAAGSKILQEIISHIPKPSKDLQSKKGSGVCCSTKSCSESQLHNSANVSPDHRDFMKDASANLKKTNSGKYAVVLKKECKKAFINNIKSYLQNNSKGLIPVKRTKSGEIIIVLNDDQKANTGGSLKITSSGNIYFIIDESIVKQKPLNIPGNKEANDSPDCDSCKSDTPKCTCEETQIDQDSGNELNDNNEECYCKPNLSNKKNSPFSAEKKHCNYCFKNHIVIKPVIEKSPHVTEMCFYTDTSARSPFYKDDVSKKHTCPGKKPDSNDWDSLCYLPVQLPFFLRNTTSEHIDKNEKI